MEDSGYGVIEVFTRKYSHGGAYTEVFVRKYLHRDIDRY